MSQELSQKQAFIKAKCPRCRQGDVFSRSIFSTKFLKMHEKCPKCGLKYEIEPGFFWGSMYISYAFSVAIALVAGVLSYNFLNDPPVWTYISIILGLLILFAPLIFRISRLLLLYLLGGINYDPKAVEKYNNQSDS